MFQAIRGFFNDWSEVKRFKALPRRQRRVVFYAEGRHDWPHFESIIEHLVGHLPLPIPYLTSEPDDPILKIAREDLIPFSVGAGSARTILFRQLETDVLVITLPDLDRYSLKRSVLPVHYLYVFHALNSSHMVYRKGAFDAYDTLLCTGPHHVAEIRRTEEIYDLPAKNLVEHGYGRLDAILRAAADRPTFQPSPGPDKKLVLAPSWGDCSFIEHAKGPELLEILLAAGHHLTLRLHPMTVRHHPTLVPALKKRFSDSNRFRIDTDMHSQTALQESDLMISDWSGSALEYAFGLERPVLFINTPPKVNNPEWEKLGLPTMQAIARDEIGAAISPEDLATIPEEITRLCADPQASRAKFREARERWVFNIGRSGEVGARAILETLERVRHERRRATEPARTGNDRPQATNS